MLIRIDPSPHERSSVKEEKRADLAGSIERGFAR
jgi:hypothetical protein